MTLLTKVFSTLSVKTHKTYKKVSVAFVPFLGMHQWLSFQFMYIRTAADKIILIIWTTDGKRIVADEGRLDVLLPPAIEDDGAGTAVAELALIDIDIPVITLDDDIWASTVEILRRKEPKTIRKRIRRDLGAITSNLFFLLNWQASVAIYLAGLTATEDKKNKKIRQRRFKSKIWASYCEKTNQKPFFFTLKRPRQRKSKKRKLLRASSQWYMG